MFRSTFESSLGRRECKYLPLHIQARAGTSAQLCMAISCYIAEGRSSKQYLVDASFVVLIKQHVRPRSC